MNKKILIVIFCFILIYGCGKKDDPIYKESKKYSFTENTKNI
tara:strand:- start:662 stop:787 length:126 start_codon:yes stop_codon:yes gene_type:complete